VTATETELDELSVDATIDAALLVEQHRLADLRVDLVDQRAFLDTGYLRLDALWSTELADALASDALAQASQARPPDTGPRTPLSSARTSLRPTPVATGPVLAAVHQALLPMARTLSGRLVVPSFAVYGYFEGNDECILHYDTDASDVTLLIMALGQVAPLRMHPELRGLTVEQLGGLECDPTWDRQSGVSVAYSASGLTAIRGRELPHHRPKSTVTGLSAVAALHYRSLYRSGPTR
jgi:hypothetical protein